MSAVTADVGYLRNTIIKMDTSHEAGAASLMSPPTEAEAKEDGCGGGDKDSSRRPTGVAYEPQSDSNMPTGSRAQELEHRTALRMANPQQQEDVRPTTPFRQEISGELCACLPRQLCFLLVKHFSKRGCFAPSTPGLISMESSTRFFFVCEPPTVHVALAWW